MLYCFDWTLKTVFELVGEQGKVGAEQQSLVKTMWNLWSGQCWGKKQWVLRAEREASEGKSGQTGLENEAEIIWKSSDVQEEELLRSGDIQDGRAGFRMLQPTRTGSTKT